MSHGKAGGPVRAQVKVATRTLIRAAMQLVEEHYRGRDIEGLLEVFVREARAMPCNTTPTDIEMLGGGGRELVAAIAAEATAEARAFAPKKGWRSPLARRLAKLEQTEDVGLCEFLFEEWSHRAKEKCLTPPKRKDVWSYVADHLGKDPDTVNRVWKRWRKDKRGQ